MLFDHGADAVISFLLAIQVMELMQVQSASLKIAVLFCAVMVIYFCALWSQYSVGFFRLGVVNPVDEGLPAYALFAIANIFIPFTFWNTTNSIGAYNYIFLLFLLGLACPVAYYMVKDNYRKAVIPAAEVSYALFLPATFAATILVLYFSSDCPFEEAVWPIFYSLMFSWSRNMIHIQLFYVTKQRFNPFNLGTLGFVLPSLAYLVTDLPPNAYFWGVAALSAFIFFEFVVSVAKQSASILKIQVFSIAPKLE
jgi:hypothetical protein